MSKFRRSTASCSCRWLAVLRSLAVLAILSALAGPAEVLAIPVPTDCLADSDGANDVSGNKDITQFCVAAGDGLPFDLLTIINFDITKINGANTADACVLFNTDGDAFADLAVCITSGGNPLSLQNVRLFTCNDTSTGRCAGSALVAGPYSTQCEVTQEDTDPFPGPAPGPGEDYPTDTQLLCGIDLSDFGAAGTGALLQDACSFESPSPSANSTDCIAFSQCSSNADCDDGSGCTTGTCTISGVCQFTPTPGAPCDDGQFCNGEEECNAFGLCAEGPGGPVDCDDGVSCTMDTCDELDDVCDNTPMNSLCSDGAFCTGVETCDAMAGCQPGTPPNCSDGVSCTVDSCNETTDTCDNTPDDGACGDAVFCNGVETCDETLGCQAGTPPDCSDSVACTTDTCDALLDECTNVPSDAACSDGQFCNGAETCDETLGCQAGSPPDCDDSIDCTIDSCDEIGDMCSNVADDAPCSNGEFCDGTETCVVGVGCVAGIAPECGDGVSCTTDSCNETTDSCDNIPDDAACSNGDFCDGVETCDAVSDCQPGTPPDCSDGVGCTIDSCNEGTDSCDNVPDDGACSNGDFCDGAESCDAVNDCQAGTPPDCSDGVGCTTDSCNETTDSCDNVADDGACDNGDFCDGAETCDAISDCQPGTPPDCNDGVTCTTDSCNEGTDSCDNVPDDGACSNGDFCDGAETCDAVSDCQPGTPPDCSDGVSCTTDSCNEGTDSCDNVPDDGACNNGDFCDGDETCDAVNDCQPGTPPDCDDGVGCTTDTCNEDADECDNTPDDDSCSNGEFCDGSEVCDPVTDCGPGDDPCPDLNCDEDTDMCFGCLDDAECDNGDYCDGLETCDAGTCAPGTPVDCDDAVGCTVDSCNEGTDSCDNVPDDGACDNGEFCDGDETCDAVSDCQAGTPPDCGDGVGCTTDSCNETTDSCDNIPDDGACDNGDFCDGAETCDAVSDCQAGTPPDCNDGVGCTTDSCNETTDSCDNVPDNGSCSNGDFCDGVEICDAVSDCQAGTPPDCNDGVGCTTDSCNETTDSCDNVPDDGACSNGDFCDGVETCDAVSDCQAGTPPDCSDGVACTLDECNETTDSCDNPPSDAFCDNGDFCDGAETCDAADDCQAGTPPNCDDGVSCTVDSCNEDADECVNTPDDDACSNGVFCDGAETCDAVTGCQPSAGPRDCDDRIDCTADSCDETGATCVNAPNDALCDDTEFCNGVESCDVVEGCVEGTPVDCGDGVDCTTDTCDEDTDSCGHTPDNALCDDALFCNGTETCHAVNGCLAGSPVACGDAFVCTTDSCNEETDSCDHDFATCVCGDSEVTGAEECDPPEIAGTFEDCNDNIDNDGDGRIDCRDPDCKPDARAPLCDESCTMDQVCARFIKDPAHIKYNRDEGPDDFYVHGRIPLTMDSLRPAVDSVTFELSNPNGPVYRASLGVGDLRSGRVGRRFRFRDRDAEELGARSARNGLARVGIRSRRIRGEYFLVFTIRAYGDFSKARHRIMTAKLKVGPQVGYLTTEWTATRRGWVMHQKDFIAEPWVVDELLDRAERLDALE